MDIKCLKRGRGRAVTVSSENCKNEGHSEFEKTGSDSLEPDSESEMSLGESSIRREGVHNPFTESKNNCNVAQRITETRTSPTLPNWNTQTVRTPPDIHCHQVGIRIG